MAGNKVKAAEWVTESYEMESNECVVAGYEVKAVKRKTVAMEAAEREVAVTKAAECETTMNEVNEAEQVSVGCEIESAECKEDERSDEGG